MVGVTAIHVITLVGISEMIDRISVLILISAYDGGT